MSFFVSLLSDLARVSDKELQDFFGGSSKGNPPSDNVLTPVRETGHCDLGAITSGIQPKKL